MNEQLPPNPPKLQFNELIKTAQVSKYMEKKACIVLLPVDVYTQVKERLDKNQIDMETFMYGACMDFLKKSEKEEKLVQDYLYFNDLRITDNLAPSSDFWRDWSAGSDVENQQDESRSRSDEK